MTDTLPILRGTAVTLRPLPGDEAHGFAEALAVDTGARPWLGSDPAVIERWITAGEVSAFVVWDGNDPVGLITFEEQTDPDYFSANIDIALLSRGTGRGLGPDAIRALAGWLFSVRGHHRITIDPAVANERSIRAYRKVGFRPVGVMRRYERTPGGEWHDNLLMDMLAEDLTGSEGHTAPPRV